MKIIEVLNDRSENKSDDTVVKKLYTLAGDIKIRACEHLKRVLVVMNEFDLHDESHAEKVLDNIENLLGDNVIDGLSVYELFLLFTSAYLHDCAMAPPEWEIQLLKATEGTDQLPLKSKLANDLKAPLSYSDSLEFIRNTKNEFLINKFSEVQKWMFSPSSERMLEEDLADLLRKYQEFRNGYADEIRKIIKYENERINDLGKKNKIREEKNIETGEDKYHILNDQIRTDFIRINHHTRIESYIKNIVTEFEEKLGLGWGEKLTNDLALICRAHGEDVSFIKGLNKTAQYVAGKDKANLQFIAIMLRLGDVIHFSSDRAPTVLRTAKQFKSEYSFHQWAIKDNGVNYIIKDGEIVYQAYCGNPNQYYELHKYIDWIDHELQNYLLFSRDWDEIYQIRLKQFVNRKGIENNKNHFEPIIGLKFSLNQQRIIELLMGVGLYKDKFACLRELYQNSLDACRCRLAELNKEGHVGKCEITFSLEQKGGVMYLCCLDNGIGMSRSTIENYLLKIGTSYYKSSEFYKKQAEWGQQFTPTSQFGIGVLSCFMIGDKLEITTRTESEDMVSCAIDGPHEFFYYKRIEELDREKIKHTGTLIKIQLTEKIGEKISDTPIEDADLFYWITSLRRRSLKNDEKYNEKYKIYENNLYNIVNRFIKKGHPKIDVTVLFNNNKRLIIQDNPYFHKCKNLKIEEINWIDSSIENIYSGHFSVKKIKYIELLDSVVDYKLELKDAYKGIEFTTILILPHNSICFEENKELDIPYNLFSRHLCVDGIIVENYPNYAGRLRTDNSYFIEVLSNLGILDFTGDVRPQLSVDRTSLITIPPECIWQMIEIGKDLSNLIIEKVQEHCETYSIEIGSTLYDGIWNYIFNKYNSLSFFFIKQILEKHPYIRLETFNRALLNNQLALDEFISMDKLILKREIEYFNSPLLYSVLLFKIEQSSLVKILEDKIIITSTPSSEIVDIETFLGESFDTDICFCADEWNIENPEYDILSNSYSILPKRVFDLIPKSEGNTNNKYLKSKTINHNISQLLEQDPLLVISKSEIIHLFGLYESDNWRGNNQILRFDNLVSPISLSFLGVNENNEKYVLYAFVAPRKLSELEEKELRKLDTNLYSDYIKGVSEGWSILVTGQEIDNLVIVAGKSKRERLVELISEEFWASYKDQKFIYTDGTEMKK